MICSFFLLAILSKPPIFPETFFGVGVRKSVDIGSTYCSALSFSRLLGDEKLVGTAFTMLGGIRDG